MACRRPRPGRVPAGRSRYGRPLRHAVTLRLAGLHAGDRSLVDLPLVGGPGTACSRAAYSQAPDRSPSAAPSDSPSPTASPSQSSSPSPGQGDDLLGMSDEEYYRSLDGDPTPRPPAPLDQQELKAARHLDAYWTPERLCETRPANDPDGPRLGDSRQGPAGPGHPGGRRQPPQAGRSRRLRAEERAPDRLSRRGEAARGLHGGHQEIPRQVRPDRLQRLHPGSSGSPFVANWDGRRGEVFGVIGGYPTGGHSPDTLRRDHASVIAAGSFGGNDWPDDLLVRWSDGELTRYGDGSATGVGHEYMSYPWLDHPLPGHQRPAGAAPPRPVPGSGHGGAGPTSASSRSSCSAHALYGDADEDL